MHPSFDLGFTTLPAYFTLLMVGITAGILIGHSEGLKRGIHGNIVLDLGLLMLLCGLLGARILHVLADGHFMDYVHLCTDPDQLPGLALGVGRRCTEATQCLSAGLGDVCDTASGLCRQGRDCLRVFKIWYGGYVFYGGLLLCIPVGMWFIRRRGGSLWAIADVSGIGIPFGLVFGRLGCFLAGCCFGGVSEQPPGVSFPRFSPAWDRHVKDHLIERSASLSLPVHPTQLYEAGACLLITLWCLYVYRRGKHFTGAVFFRFVAGYATFRILVEFIRADDRGQWLWGTVTTSQLVSLPLLVWAIWVLVRRRPWPAGSAGLTEAPVPAGARSASDAVPAAVEPPAPAARPEE